MTTNAIITVWHYDEERECYIRKTFEKVWVHNVYKHKDAGSAHGKITGRVCKIRIPAIYDVGLRLGDYVRVGRHTSEMPERGIDMVITEIADNVKGSSPHWRVLCE